MQKNLSRCLELSQTQNVVHLFVRTMMGGLDVADVIKGIGSRGNMMKIQTTPKCKKCGHRFPMGFDDGSGLPVMVGFETKDGKTINLCKHCLIELGKAKENGTIDEFFKSIGV